jgi:hypothetical protein
MTWRGTLRSIAAAQRRVEREALRKQRELDRQRKQLEKMQMREQAAYEVQVYENYIDVLVSIHSDCGEAWDWESIHVTDPPVKPSRSDANGKIAQGELDTYKPGFTDKLLKRSETKRLELIAAVEEGKKQDELVYQEALKEYEQDYADWEVTRELANRILAGDTEAYMEAIKQADPFKEISQLGSSIEFNAIDNSMMEATLHVKSENVVPNEEKTLLSSGKLSVKKLSKSRFYEIYQDYVCGAVLRVARELFSLLPIEMTIVTAVGELLNTQTGHLEEQPILSVAIPRDTLIKLNFAMLDPSDAMDNFLHNMKFLKSKGFTAVDRITPADLGLS